MQNTPHEISFQTCYYGHVAALKIKFLRVTCICRSKIETSKVINLLKLSYKFDASACYVDLKKVGAQKCKKSSFDNTRPIKFYYSYGR